jgi:hypothetical protein
MKVKRQMSLVIEPSPGLLFKSHALALPEVTISTLVERSKD